MKACILFIFALCLYGCGTTGRNSSSFFGYLSELPKDTLTVSIRRSFSRAPDTLCIKSKGYSRSDIVIPMDASGSRFRVGKKTASKIFLWSKDGTTEVVFNIRLEYFGRIRKKASPS